MYLYFYVTVYQHRTIFLVRFILYRPKLYLYVSTYVFVDLSVFLMILRRAASDEVIVVRTVVWVSLYIRLGISSLGILLLETPQLVEAIGLQPLNGILLPGSACGP